ncbi:MAG: YkgJ family cysteine cluster protein [Planctomycetaceae bacterium]|nr:YkgJ family cysteine cluster protein [Planctomycetaceae bacterium]
MPNRNQPHAFPLLQMPTCAGCGACCQLTPIPPFAPGECEQREVPSEWLGPIHARVTGGQQFELTPCVWFDTVQQTCQHYDYRPGACREFELGGAACVSARWRILTAESTRDSVE